MMIVRLRKNDLIEESKEVSYPFGVLKFSHKTLLYGITCCSFHNANDIIDDNLFDLMLDDNIITEDEINIFNKNILYYSDKRSEINDLILDIFNRAFNYTMEQNSELKDILTSNKFKLYRSIVLDTPESLDLDNLGVAWSYDYTGAVPYDVEYDSNMEYKAILSIECDTLSVDYPITMIHNLYMGSFADEKEIRLRQYNDVYLVDVEMYKDGEQIEYDFTPMKTKA